MSSQPIKICPNCQQTTLLQAAVCGRCGHHFSTRFEPNRTQAVNQAGQLLRPSQQFDLLGSSTSDRLAVIFTLQPIAGIVGGIFGLIGSFAPLVGFPLGITVNLMTFPEGYLVIVASIGAVVLSSFRGYVGPGIMAVSSLVAVGYRFSRIQGYRSEGDNAAQMMSQLQWGWMALLLSSMLILVSCILGIVVQSSLKSTSTTAHNSLVRNVRKSVSLLVTETLLTICFCVAIGWTTFFAYTRNNPQTLNTDKQPIKDEPFQTRQNVPQQQPLNSNRNPLRQHGSPLNTGSGNADLTQSDALNRIRPGMSRATIESMVGAPISEKNDRGSPSIEYRSQDKYNYRVRYQGDFAISIESEGPMP
ncbi:MAG: hypothetical protein ABJA67_08430 [Chthonomonadales bacterium]